MAKQKGIFKIQGTLGGMTFYDKDGATIIREKGGIDRSRILNDPNFVRTRENMSEFGGSAKVGKAFRQGYNGVPIKAADSTLAGRVTGLMKRVNAKGTGIRGQREFEILTNKAIVEGFELNKSKALAATFRAPYTATANADRNEVVLTIPDFEPRDFVALPSGVTHFRLALNIAVMSDYSFNTDIRSYEPLQPNENGLRNSETSSYLSIYGPTGAINITATLPGSPVLPTATSLIVSLGIGFYQELNSSYYPLEGHNAMQIIAVV